MKTANRLIKRVHYEQGLRCFDSNLVAVLQMEGIEYSELFQKTWGFSFDESVDCLGASIQYDFHIPALAKKINHVKIQKIEAEAPDTALDMISESKVFDYYVQIKADTYDCSWHRAYQQTHNTHYLLALGCNNEHIEVLDPMCTNHIQYLPMDAFKRCFDELYLIHVCGINTTPAIFKAIPCDDWIKNIIRFAYPFQNSEVDLDMELKMLPSDSYACPLYRNLWTVANGRSLFALYYCDRPDDPIKESFQQLKCAWHSVRAKLTIDYLRGWPVDQRRLGDDIMALSEKEKRLLERIHNSRNAYGQ